MLFVVESLLPEIFNNSKLLVFIHDEKSQYLIKLVQEKLHEYERQVKLRPSNPSGQWTFTNSIIYVCSTISTIGYSHIYPLTKAGKICSMICSIFGIPFTIMVMKDLAFLITILLNYPCILLVKLWHVFRFCTLQPVDENELITKIHGMDHKQRCDYRLSSIERLLDIPVMVAVLALLGWVVVGCLLIHFLSVEEDSTIDIVYFVFNSLTTIGVGNLDAQDDSRMLLILFVYILIGLTNVSLFVNLIHTKFSRVYWLPGRMYLPLNNLYRKGFSDCPQASFESFQEDAAYSDCTLSHYTTLGILQSEDRCPLLGVIRKEEAYKDAITQTTNSASISKLRFRERTCEPILPIPRNIDSPDNVNELIVETY
ncbi:hypothetical protein QR680_000002 [Steinernema hermaphroditum]|uniref:Potassium channel domain-containing protein n=1 Tax=Steinernema hermaphroditum TaxID=289476 RepID=A0AA39LD93_9BILA|nr:hypothetical protein QR680_000002 [Steinernema hermaphroditum]